MPSTSFPPADDATWSGWQLLPGHTPIAPAVLAEILDGGQAFRWYRENNDAWVGTFGSSLLRLSADAGGALRWSAPAASAKTSLALAHYWEGERPLDSLVDSLPWRSDAHLARCLAEFPGLRILRQPFGETLLCFLCSATKQIVQIKQMVGLLAERHGERLTPGGAGSPEPVSLGYRLPSWAEIAEIPEAELRACQLGFRARYIHQTAKFIAAHPGWLEETEALPYAAARERLCLLPGVGGKVADCVLLFGAGRLEAFPVDTWILKAMAARYGLAGWKPAQVAQFGRAHFGPLAGLAQQYLFAWERRMGRART
ncbi:MAG: helix-hairpin-helix motif [Verrucomicrobia bacterium]|nr:helix-hairpin-helix motif [Verrucomicrobiota bacterium]